MTVALTEKATKLGLDDKEIAWLGSQAFIGGITVRSQPFFSTLVGMCSYKTQSTTTLNWFAFAMVLHPDIAKKARDEVDAVAGRDCPPRLVKKDQLVYLTAVMKEVMRWRPSAALGNSLPQDILPRLLMGLSGRNATCSNRRRALRRPHHTRRHHDPRSPVVSPFHASVFVEVHHPQVRLSRSGCVPLSQHIRSLPVAQVRHITWTSQPV